MFVKSKEKVAYYYEEIENNIAISFNETITFYAASTIKLLIVLYLYEAKIDLTKTLKITKEDIKRGSGIIKLDTLPASYTIKELAIRTIKYSDNTAYIKLVEWITKEKLQKYSKKIGLLHGLEGKDFFGITSVNDMKKILEKIYEYSKEDKELKEALENPTYKIIESKNISHQKFLRKYGSFGIAYHEVGVVESEHPYYLIIMTQKGENSKTKRFINRASKKIAKIHHMIQREKGN